MTESYIVLTNTLVSRVHDAIEEADKLAKFLSFENPDGSQLQAAGEQMTRLQNMLTTISTTSNHMLSFAERAHESYVKLEEEAETTSMDLSDAKLKIQHLSTNPLVNWSEACPTNLALRRTNETRLQCIRNLQKDMAVLRRENVTLQREFQQSHFTLEANNFDLCMQVDQLRGDLKREQARNHVQSREIERLKRSERLSKRNGVRKATGSHGTNMSDLSKQLEGLVLQATRQRCGQGQAEQPIETITVDDTSDVESDNISNFDMMMRLAVELQDATGGLLPEFSGFDNISIDTILDELPQKLEAAK